MYQAESRLCVSLEDTEPLQILSMSARRGHYSRMFWTSRGGRIKGRNNMWFRLDAKMLARRSQKIEPSFDVHPTAAGSPQGTALSGWVCNFASVVSLVWRLEVAVQKKKWCSGAKPRKVQLPSHW